MGNKRAGAVNGQGAGVGPRGCGTDDACIAVNNVNGLAAGDGGIGTRASS